MSLQNALLLQLYFCSFSDEKIHFVIFSSELQKIVHTYYHNMVPLF